ncbi:MAG: PAS domain S-box protein [Ardenticatenaceae bacterium]|nr:PAS domain S-box protein [Anaerolineales bacterium]MCB8923885.1 PAS domain S-box protein [Ardenticatenaceae bacterium]MCB8990470.1 PAS domain S-box protein [Ardenticatenaceae bacterium]MCB9003484.1 PAS domain S-box protein [Ardenticatenaceae bacterium]
MSKKLVLNGLRTLQSYLIEPLQELPSERHKREARLLASVLLIVFLTSSVATILDLLSRPPEVAFPLLGPIVGTLVCVLIAYFMSRSRYFARAILLFAITFPIGISALAIQDNRLFLLPIYLIVPTFFVSILAKMSIILVSILFNFSLLLLVMWRIPEAQAVILDANTLLLYVAFTFPGLFLAHYRNLLDENRQQSLRQNEARLKSYFENANDWVFTLDRNGLMTSANRQIYQTTGYSPDDLIGKSPLWLVSAESRDYAAKALQAILTGEVVQQLEVKVLLRDGRSLWLEIRGNLLEGEEGVYETIHFGRDVTERKLAEQAEREHRQLAEALQTIATTLNSTLNLEEVFDRVLATVGDVVPYDVADIMLIQDGVGRMVRHQGYDKYNVIGVIDALEMVVADVPNLRYMYETHKPLAIWDTSQEPGWIDIPRLGWVRSLAGAPIVLDDVCIGFLHVTSQLPGYYQEEHAVRLQAFSEHVATAVRNAQLYQAESERRQLAETLRQTTAVLNSTLSLDEVLQRILEQLKVALSFDSASVQQLVGNKLILRMVIGFSHPEKIINLAIPIGKKWPNAHVMSGRGPVAYDDVTVEYPHFQDDSDLYQSGKIRSWLGVPLTVNDEIIGLVTVDRNEVQPYTAEEISVATTFAQHAAIALNNADLYERLARHNEELETAVAHRTIELQQTASRVNTILQNSPDALLLLDDHLQMQIHNEAFHDMFGYTDDNICTDFPACLVIPSETPRLLKAIHISLENIQRIRLEFTAQRQDGSQFDADIVIAPIHQPGTPTQLLCSIQDITAFKEVERVKDDFVSNVSHELRTPIASLQLYHDLLHLNPAKSERYMAQLGREIARLNTIVEGLLQLSRLDQERIEWDIVVVNLNDLAQEYAIDRQPLAADQDITLTYELAERPLQVQADGNLLGQVIGILITNALNYTQPGGTITLCVRDRVLYQRHWAGISVTDTGRGISETELPQLLKRFYRGTAARESNRPGTGLGLAIADEIVRRHRGEIEIASPGPGKGSTFTIWLPAALP